ncbi:hypothetical protein GCM10027062_38240 [Nocardioides hungaricus]
MSVTASQARKRLFPLIEKVNNDLESLQQARSGDGYEQETCRVWLVFTPDGWDDYQHWLQADRQILKRINRLIDDALRDPTDGIGKPEPLRHMFAGAWSRRITDEHRLVYLVDDEDLVVLQARFRYQ